MRLTLTKLHRGFRELDGMSEAQCRLWLAAVRRSRAADAAAVGALGVVIIPAVWVTLGVAAAMLFDRLRAAGYRDVDGFLRVGLTLLVTVSGPAAALVVRDLWLRSAIRTQIERARCPGCGRSLLGCRLTARGVRCQCGRGASLADLGVSPLDLAASPEPTRCVRCAYELEGLRWEGSARRCPECGELNGAEEHRL